MAIKRTVTQESQTKQASAVSMTYSLPTQRKASTKTTPPPEPNVSHTTLETAFFGYPVSYIYRDIIKTVLITAVTLLVLAVIALRT